jgi:hypothetical protein
MAIVGVGSASDWPYTISSHFQPMVWYYYIWSYGAYVLLDFFNFGARYFWQNERPSVLCSNRACAGQPRGRISEATARPRTAATSSLSQIISERAKRFRNRKKKEQNLWNAVWQRSELKVQAIVQWSRCGHVRVAKQHFMKTGVSCIISHFLFPLNAILQWKSVLQIELNCNLMKTFPPPIMLCDWWIVDKNNF